MDTGDAARFRLLWGAVSGVCWYGYALGPLIRVTPDFGVSKPGSVCATERRVPSDSVKALCWCLSYKEARMY
jgi:hypothetical protein